MSSHPRPHTREGASGMVPAIRFDVIVQRAVDNTALPVIVLVCVMTVATLWVRLQRPVIRGTVAQRVERMKVELNSADADALCLLPGIGKQLAHRIVVDRRQRGAFASVDELQRVSGIGPQTVAAIDRLVACDQ